MERITTHPDILFGKPSIRGLRYPVTLILDLLASGMSINETLEDHEDLEAEDIYACLKFTAKLTEVKSIHKLQAA
ncbi:hypothetical protein CEQ90_08950 [Lewinellaceae bacterium SD302]|nr:hypothetical protein CEQ90_08950 [Lewinellaceae bacterium SD302]